ncbi:universal stress protein [Mycobacterium paraterrae]|nr:universal stress protein [Mycobacterium paraterrae]
MSASVSVGIVVGVDDSPASDAAVGWATRNAIERRLPLTLVHAIVARR